MEMKTTKLYNLDKGIMRVAGLMSGSGSNLRKIIEHEKNFQSERGMVPYHVAVIFSDRFDSNASQIGKDFDIPVVIRDIAGFYEKKGKPLRDLEVREKFDAQTLKLLSPHEIDVAAYAGYMSIATSVLTNAFLGVNVHPADLSIKNQEGERAYTGDHAVRDAILAGEEQLRSTTHLVAPKVDYGRILMISSGLDISHLPKSKNNEVTNGRVDSCQNKLKEVGDWVIFPKTLEYIAEGRYSQDGKEGLYFNDIKIVDGVKLKD